MKVPRHGDISLVPIKTLPKLKQSNTKVIYKGSHGNPHSIDKGELYLTEKGDFTIGYLRAKDTTLTHLEHGDKKTGKLMIAKLPDGVYEIHKQVEYTPQGLKPVED